MTNKARTLAVLAAAGLPVPEGFVLDADAPADEALAALLEGGPVAIRGAAVAEDGQDHSGAGLSTSVLGVRSLEQAGGALATVAQAQRIVQRQIVGRTLVVAAATEHGIELDAYALGDESDAEVLSGTRTPTFSGRLARWPDPVGPRLGALVEDAVRVAAAAGLSTHHGWDLELVLDHADGVWLVQLRPLTAALHPGWADFTAAVAESQDRETADFGPHRLTLDAEHNPAPLSVAHTWVMERLEAERGAAAGSPVVLAGWLYVATLPRNLAGASRREAPLTPTAALDELVHRLIPDARGRLTEVRRRVDDDPHGTSVDETREAAWSAFLAMIDAYVGVLVPARRAAAKTIATADAGDPEDPLTLRERARFADVLPAIWDLDSATLAELGVPHDPTTALPPIPEDPTRAATLLAEWDDHLFALGLAPLREVFRWVGRITGLGDDVFLLRGDELSQAVVEGDRFVARRDSRRAQRQRAAALRPPLVIDEGRPVAAGSRARLHGIPIGPSAAGPVTVRNDLGALLERPPAADAIVMMPALTAPAAVALQRASVRAVCCEYGGPLSHAALMARELGLSALIGCHGCTDLAEGTRVRLDTTVGRLILLDGS